MCDSYNFQYKTNYKCLMPCNLYGPGDNYNLHNSHFLPALVSKIHNAKIKNKKFIKIWGTGAPKRELMYVDDLADACIYFLNKKTKETLINVGSSMEKSIIDYAKFIINELDLNLKINKDLTKPDGTPRKIVDISIAKKYGWKAKVDFKEGFKKTYLDYKKIMKNIIVVTGGAGFIGSNMIDYLLFKTTKNIISIDNYSTGLKKSYKE